MTGKWKRCSAEFKAKVALEALRVERRVAELGAKRGGGRRPRGRDRDAHAKIGQRVLERDFGRKPPVDEPVPEATDD